MEVGMSLNSSLIRLPIIKSSFDHDITTTTSSSLILWPKQPMRKCEKGNRMMLRGGRFVVEAKAKGKRTTTMPGQFQRQAPPPLPKVEEDGNPKFVIFIRMAKVYLWYPMTLVTGGTTAKIIVAAKDTFLGKYIYKDTLNRNLAAVVYRDEKELINTAKKQFRLLRSGTEFRFGYKLVENGNVRSALAPANVIELPTPDKLKTVADRVKDFFTGAKESASEIFGELTTLPTLPEEPEAAEAENSK